MSVTLFFPVLECKLFVLQAQMGWDFRCQLLKIKAVYALNLLVCMREGKHSEASHHARRDLPSKCRSSRHPIPPTLEGKSKTEGRKQTSNTLERTSKAEGQGLARSG